MKEKAFKQTEMLANKSSKLVTGVKVNIPVGDAKSSGAACIGEHGGLCTTAWHGMAQLKHGVALLAGNAFVIMPLHVQLQTMRRRLQP